MTKRKRERTKKLVNAKNKRNSENGVRFKCPACVKDYSRKGVMVDHFRKDHADLCEPSGSCAEHGIQPKGASNIYKPEDVGLNNYEWMFLKTMVGRSLCDDVKKEKKYNSPFANSVKQLKGSPHNERVHELTRSLYHWWIENQPDRHDMVGGCIPLELFAHATWMVSPDRIDNTKEHFVDGGFANIRFVPLKLNTPYSFVQEFGTQTREKLRELYLAPKQDTDVEAWIAGLRALPKDHEQNIVCRLYHSAKLRTKTRCRKINQPIPKPPTHTDFFENIFAVALRRQHGRCAITSFEMNENLVGSKCFQMSLDRTDPTILNYWDLGNIQIVCCGAQIIDSKRKQVMDEDGDSAWSTELFLEYIGVNNSTRTI